MGLDTETTGLDPYNSKIILLQIGTKETQYVIDCRDFSLQELSPVLRLLEDDNIIKVLVNAKFDYKQLRHNFKTILSNVEDCMISEMILYCGIKDWGYSLQAMAKRYLNYEFGSKQLSLFDTTLYKGIRNEISKVGDDPLDVDMIRYAAGDVELALKIREKQLPLLKATNLLECAKLEWEYTMVLGDMEINGMYLDPTKWRALYEDTMSQLSKIEGRIRNWLADNAPEFEDINLASPKQMVNLLKTLGIDTKIIDKKKTENPDDPIFKDTTSSTHIQQYDHPFIEMLLEYREYFKATSTYGLKFLKNHIHPTTGRVHSEYWQILNTGRISSHNPNLQNIKAKGRGVEYRKCFTASNSLNTLIVGDYSGQELRVLADKSQEPSMIDTFLHGDGDLHRKTASLMYHVQLEQVSKEQRYNGKQTNFLMSYGGGAFKLSKNMSIPFHEAEEIIKKYYKAYPKLKKYFENGHRAVLTRGYILIDNIVNRRSYSVYFKEYALLNSFISYFKRRGWYQDIPKSLRSKYYKLKGKMERDSQNFPIQGTSASMSKYAAILIRRYIKRNNFWNSFKIVNMVHDEIVLEVNKAFRVRAKQVLQDCMIKAGKTFSPSVPMEVAPVDTPTWVH